MITKKTIWHELADVFIQRILYFLSLIKFSLFFVLHWKKINTVYKNPKKTQDKILHYILNKNKNVSYLQQHHLEKNPDYLEFKKKIPIKDYEYFRQYIEKNIKTGEKTLTQESPLFFTKTSGTLGLPKYIPITQEGKQLYKKSQNLLSFNLFLSNHKVLNGKIFAISSPTKEEKLNKDYFAGSMSGVLREENPLIIRKKFIIPPEILSIPSYTDKYLLFTLIALCEKNVAILTTANPSTLLKILSVLNNNRIQLINTLKSGNLQDLGLASLSIKAAQKTSIFTISSKRRKQMISLLQSNKNIKYSHIWPQLKSIITWTKGSCSYLIPQLESTIPSQCSIFDLGYLSSEFRGTITLKNKSVPAIQESFFEFSEYTTWEAGKKEIIRLHELKQEKLYYIFITTFNGLYRYNINDIVKVTGYYLNSPCFEFMQKGKGITNITGEKLYENQLISAVNKAQEKLDLSIPFFICLANQKKLSYTLYIEGLTTSISLFQKIIHSELCNYNIQYKEKTYSERLNPIQVIPVLPETGEKYKQHCILKGQRDAQLKNQHLQYLKDIDYDFSKQVLLTKNQET